MNETSAHGPVVRDRYRPADFETERYSPENLSFWTPLIVRLGRIRHHDKVLDLGCATAGLTAAVAEANGAHVVGCDRSVALLDYGRRVRGRLLTPSVCADGDMDADAITGGDEVSEVGPLIMWLDPAVDQFR